MHSGRQEGNECETGNGILTRRLHAERARGAVRLSVAASGLKTLREDGSLKIRLPSGARQAILINTAGGMAGGDLYRVEIEASGDSRLAIASQAAERVYRTLGPSAEVAVSHRVRDRARLLWLPQETILFDESGLSRRLDVDIDEGATFLGMESTVLGRHESGERIRHIALRENWTVRRNGQLLHSERVKIDGAPPCGLAELGDAGAFASLLLVSPDAETFVEACRQALGPRSAVSAWNGRLVVRLLEADGFRLRKQVLALLPALLPPTDIPPVWLL